jgi:IS30 family transposase
MILLSQRGWPASTIADLLGTDPSTVRRWIRRYNTHGVAGLADRPRSHQSAADDLRCGRCPHRPVVLPGCPQGGQYDLHRLL